eukprot:scaffold1821_cov344-Pavlova_lutheri.AAC.2
MHASLFRSTALLVLQPRMLFPRPSMHVVKNTRTTLLATVSIPRACPWPYSYVPPHLLDTASFCSLPLSSFFCGGSDAGLIPLFGEQFHMGLCCFRIGESPRMNFVVFASFLFVSQHPHAPGTRGDLLQPFHMFFILVLDQHFVPWIFLFHPVLPDPVHDASCRQFGQLRSDPFVSVDGLVIHEVRFHEAGGFHVHRHGSQHP